MGLHDGEYQEQPSHNAFLVAAFFAVGLSVFLAAMALVLSRRPMVPQPLSAGPIDYRQADFGQFILGNSPG